MWLLTSMNSLMLCKLRASTEGLPAVLTVIEFLTAMNSLMFKKA
ncbi:unnamed protein product [Gulo gulo]|uniref:Uncharacterized protein n=1 Tax=Gulo gulo TaxID=48420 RepID=A0A9X9M013_GULGU|nr:unnamed protein product [Gulo gulo]